MENTIEINGQKFTIEQLNSIIEQAKNANPMDKVYAYHGTTKEEFDKIYKLAPDHIKAMAQEELIVKFYNKGEEPDWDNSNQRKYYPWFYLGSNFRLYSVVSYCSNSTCSARLSFIREEDCREATKEFFDIYKRSRNN